MSGETLPSERQTDAQSEPTTSSRPSTLTTADRIADEAVTVAAIGALAVIATTTSADPTTVVATIGGLGGFRLHKRAGK